MVQLIKRRTDQDRGGHVVICYELDLALAKVVVVHLQRDDLQLFSTCTKRPLICGLVMLNTTWRCLQARDGTRTLCMQRCRQITLNSQPK